MKSLVSNYVISGFILSTIIFPASLFAAPRFDLNDDKKVSPLDALILINALNNNERDKQLITQLDVNGDGILSPIDALLLINELNSKGIYVDKNGKEIAKPKEAELKPQVDQDIFEGPQTNEIEIVNTKAEYNGYSIFIDTFSQYDAKYKVENFVPDGEVATLRNISDGYDLYRTNSDLSKVIFTEENLSNVWGKKRVSSQERIRLFALPANGQSGIGVTTSDFTFTVFDDAFNKSETTMDGAAALTGGSYGSSNSIYHYTAQKDDELLDLTKAKKLYMRFKTDHMSTTEYYPKKDSPHDQIAPNYSEFEFIIKDKAGKTHTALYKVPFYSTRDNFKVAPANHLNGAGVKVLKWDIKRAGKSIDLKEVKSLTVRVRMQQAQDMLIDYFKISMPPKFLSPEDLDTGFH